MDMPINTLKRNLREGKTQIGCWLSLGNTIAAEICAAAGFDWVLIDTEHAPNDLVEVHQQLLAVPAFSASPVVRAAWNDTVVIKRLLDVGVQSLLIPYVQNEEEARRAAAAVRYPPHGIRGVSTGSRSSRFGRVKDYLPHAHAEICVLVQIETRQGLENVEKIAAVEGIDGLFVGPQDLAADLGHLGNPGHPEVQAAIAAVIARTRKAGKAAGILYFDEAGAKRWIQQGAQMIAVTSDSAMLVRESSTIAAKYR
ncbi:MAG: HpcH/HpaI aldolase/citrate lyase family protein [Betaproteobacteria bacterium]|nr:HpcH/HpaI aldolase/citrate lyase family protein [Betaproteobacteria bacterium]